MATEQEGHTPGPWEARRCGELFPDRWNVFALLPTEGGRPQNIRTIDQVLDYCGAAEAEANARLIAAAPDLLEALRTVRDWVADAASGQSFFSQAPADIVEMAVGDIARIDAAIARATGEA